MFAVDLGQRLVYVASAERLLQNTFRHFRFRVRGKIRNPFRHRRQVARTRSPNHVVNLPVLGKLLINRRHHRNRDARSDRTAPLALPEVTVFGRLQHAHRSLLQHADNQRNLVGDVQHRERDLPPSFDHGHGGRVDRRKYQRRDAWHGQLGKR
uniref:(northern house mosquito) hypothetical protein n=1 Tax=Culex pipiens TaxID=7175 RepID=A0A8D8JD62_CULPI